MKRRDMQSLSVILTVLISLNLLSCAPAVIMPEIEYISYPELKQSEPDCTAEIEALEALEEKTDDSVLEALFCYRSVWKHWENSYRVLDAQLQAIKDRKR